MKFTILALAGILLAGAAFATQDSGKKERPKSEDHKVAEIGKAAPAFTLKDLAGKEVSLSDYKGKTVVLEWFQPSCPYCVGTYKDDGACRTTSERLAKEGVVWLLVNSTNSDNPDSKVENNKEFFDSRKLSRTVLMDTDGRVGHAYGAKSTPHCMVIDAKGNLAYRGAIDNAQEKDAKEKVNYVAAAIAELKAEKPVSISETRSYGCGVKYKDAKP
ncbi:MAG: redoxin domain-containing protein [Planctomycetes bacterium]|nr:redoxin domain-containing protein [Planctomycetota bacterium]